MPTGTARSSAPSSTACRLPGLYAQGLYRRELPPAPQAAGGPDAIYPQFATHNAQTSTIYQLAQTVGGSDYSGQYRIPVPARHGRAAVRPGHRRGAEGKLARPCRIYAPVGSHETCSPTWCAGCWRTAPTPRSSTALATPACRCPSWSSTRWSRSCKSPAKKAAWAPHPKIALPVNCSPAVAAPTRLGPKPVIFANEHGSPLAARPALARAKPGWPHPLAWLLPADPAAPCWQACADPAELRDTVGWCARPAPTAHDRRRTRAAPGRPSGQAHRRQPLPRAAAPADLLEQRSQPLMGLIQREAGKTLPNAVAEIREAVDFAALLRRRWPPSSITRQRLGVVLAISPWNFPLAIFAGQVAAALAAGNTVLAKPGRANAAHGRRHGQIPRGRRAARCAAVRARPRRPGAALVAHPQVAGVMFTGSTEVAASSRASWPSACRPAASRFR